MSEPIVLSEEQIKHMVDRFLGWYLPKDFAPDGGITFKKLAYQAASDTMPTGTNVLDARQAEAMVRYMLDAPPKTKMVEVWRVEWAYRVQVDDRSPFWQTTARHYEREHVARVTAKTLEAEGINACIRVTGPHQQEVPA